MNRAVASLTATLCLCLLPVAACHPVSGDASAVVRTFGGVGLGRGEFSYPRGLSVSPADGRVFIVDKSARVQRFSPAGEYETEWRMPEYENGKPTGLCVDQSNTVWIADTHYSRVIAYDRDGRELLRFGSPGKGEGEFIWPTNIAADEQDQSILVGEFGGNDRISRFSRTGEYRGSFGQGLPEAGGTARPQGLAIDERGVVWVADSANHRVARYERNGRFIGATGSLGGGAGQFQCPYSIALAADGTAYVSDYGNNRIVKLDRGGGVIGSWGRMGREPGEIRHAWSIDIAPDGLLYVLDSWNSRVCVVRW